MSSIEEKIVEQLERLNEKIDSLAEEVEDLKKEVDRNKERIEEKIRDLTETLNEKVRELDRKTNDLRDEVRRKRWTSLALRGMQSSFSFPSLQPPRTIKDLSRRPVPDLTGINSTRVKWTDRSIV